MVLLVALAAWRSGTSGRASGVTGAELGVTGGEALPTSSSGVRMVRIWDQGLNWGDLQPSGPFFDQVAYGRLKTLASTAARNGLQPMIVLWGTPTWAAPGCPPDLRYGTLSCPVAPSDLAAWTSFVYDVAYEFADRKYLVGGEGPVFEVWNEPDDPLYWSPDQPTPAGQTADDILVTLTRLASEQVKAAAADRNARTGEPTSPSTVVCCGWARTGYAAMSRWLGRGGGRYVDAISYHPYPRLSPAAPTDGADVAAITDRFRSRTTLPLWATEVGANNCATDIPGPCIDYSAQQHVDVVQSTLFTLNGKGIDRVVWYQWLDSGPVSPSNPMVQRLGLRPVLDAVVRGVPTAPTQLQVTAGTTMVSLRWTAAGDGAADGDPRSPHGVTVYNVHRGTEAGFRPTTGNRIAQVSGTTYGVSRRATATSYYYKVTAQDAAGHVGAPSNEVRGAA